LSVKNWQNPAKNISATTAASFASGANFTNILCEAFISADPKSIKIQSSHRYLFVLLGSALVKAAHKTLLKLTPAVVNSSGELIRKRRSQPFIALSAEIA